MIGSHLGASCWHRVDKHRLDLFSRAIHDRTNEPTAVPSSPVAPDANHGLLLLSMAAGLSLEALDFTGVDLALNRGINRARFRAGIPLNSWVRMTITLSSVRDRPMRMIEVISALAFEVRGDPDPICTAESIAILRRSASSDARLARS